MGIISDIAAPRRVSRTIEKMWVSYENILVKFVGDQNIYYLDKNFFNGMRIDGNIIQKRTRTWFVR